MNLILGIDEAGRGPVIGPMVVAGVLVKREGIAALREIGVRDSKMLTREEREGLFTQIKKICESAPIVIFPPDNLDENLTQVELRAMANIIQQCRPDGVFLDAPVPPGGIQSFTKRLLQMLDGLSPKIVAENRADDTYEVVSAASIVAKVQRDRMIEELWAEHGNFGWGYPHEEKTREFLRACYRSNRKFPECVRHRWATVQKIIYECDAGVLPF